MRNARKRAAYVMEEFDSCVTCALLAFNKNYLHIERLEGVGVSYSTGVCTMYIIRETIYNIQYMYVGRIRGRRNSFGNHSIVKKR